MQIIPAIDIKDGHCVRLKQGDMHSATVFSEDPAAMAQHWLELGAERLHLVDLNGAVAGKPKNEMSIREIVAVIDRQARHKVESSLRFREEDAGDLAEALVEKVPALLVLPHDACEVVRPELRRADGHELCEPRG